MGPSAETTLISNGTSVLALLTSAQLSLLITQTHGTPDITSKTENGTATHTSPMAWVPTSTGSKAVTPVGGNLTTESKMEPTTGTTVDILLAMLSINAKAKKTSNSVVDSPSLTSSTEQTVVMSPSLQSPALMPSLLLKFLERTHTQPPPSFLVSPLLPPVLPPSATSPSRELRLHSNKAFMPEPSFDS